MINKKQKKNSKGFIAAYVLIAAAVVITLLGGLLVFVGSSQRRASDEVSRQQALQIAESGIYFYKWYLSHSLDGKTAQQIKNFWEGGTAYGYSVPYEQEVTDNDATPIGRYRINVSVPRPDSTIVMVTSEGWTYKHPGIVKSVQVRFRRPSWSEYSVLANDVMRFGEGTHVYGPIHSNNGIRFDGIAHNLVSSSVEDYWDPDTSSTCDGVWTSQSDEDATFLAGKEFPVASVDFGSVVTDLALIKSEAQADGLYLGGDTYEESVCGWTWIGPPWPWWDWQCSTNNVPVEGYHLTLRTDDRVEVRLVTDSGSSSHRIYDETGATTYDFPNNGLVFVENHVWVDGQIDGYHLTVASGDLEQAGVDTDVYINNDITYTNTDGTDIIGLIAENDVSVGLYSEDNLEIHAALLAQNGRVGRDYYNFGTSATYYKRDTITVYGSIATNQRYGFRWICGGNTYCSGYLNRNLHFDNNLLYFPPPFFPTGTTYELDLWEDL
ncbi:MAG: pilus assembly PilX N-terminal domain-containing protein [Patescibacteria group bacterium]|nr:pilus assembly PilX N-terminal domain-containing protein [Patescibacteria group bacterium]